MVVRPIAKLSDEVDQVRHASPSPVNASMIASVSRLHAAARLDHCAGATQGLSGSQVWDRSRILPVRGHTRAGRLSGAADNVAGPVFRFPSTSRMHLHLGERVLDAWSLASATRSEVVRRQALTWVFGCGDRVTVSGCRWMASAQQSRLGRTLTGRGTRAAGPFGLAGRVPGSVGDRNHE
jgi:hypothetical protein